jgi:chromate transporter
MKTELERDSLGELAGVFLKLGTTAFGGPAAHIAMMREEAVVRRGWITEAEFLDYLGAVNLIPGPNSTEMAIHIGHRRAGWRGLLVAGTCFILPAALLVAAIAWAYVRYGTLPAARGLLYGVKPVVIAVVAQAVWGLTKTAVRTRWLAFIGIVATVLAFLQWNELAILGMGAAAAVVTAVPRDRKPIALFGLVPATASAGAVVGWWSIFSVFAKVGAVLFGSGYVLLAFLRTELVEHRGWLTSQQLLDAIAVGQVTPGPVFTTATFVGYLLHGASGAVAATLGIFCPAFVFVALSAWLLPMMRRSPVARAALDGVNVASLGLMAAVTVQLGQSALVDPFTWILAAASALLLVRYKVNSAWLVIIAGLLGIAIKRG